MLRVDSSGAYLMPYVTMRFRDYRQLIAYYESLGRTYDEAAALAAILSNELDSARCG